MEFDLLGHPIPANKGKPGANGHTPTPENANTIRLLLVAGFTLEGICRQLDLSVPTLRKHYFQNGKVNLRQARARAIAEARGRNLLLLDAEASKGNVSALKEMRKVINESALDLLDQSAQDRGKGKSRGKGEASKDAVAKASTARAGQKILTKINADEAEERLQSLWDRGTAH